MEQKDLPRIVADNQAGYIFFGFQIIFQPFDRVTIQLNIRSIQLTNVQSEQD